MPHTTPTTHPAPDDLDGVLAIGEYRPGSAAVLTDAERWPTLTADGRARLQALRTHPHAPRWSHETGDRLTADAVARVVAESIPPQTDWLDAHLNTARLLPAYRGRRDRLYRLADFPTLTRDNLLADIAAYVPYDADLTQLLHGTSSGSTGHALAIPDDIEDTARTFWFMVRLARNLGVDWRPDPTRMALAHIVAQRQAFTYASILSAFDQMTMARLNLDPRSWPERDSFLLDQQPQVFSGTPAALETLLAPRLRAVLQPLALFSSATDLAPALRRDLETTYRVPVIDIYSLHETRPIAFRADDGPFRVVDRRVLVEIRTDDGQLTTTPGAVGEIVVTAGENPLLPLARYRTGDFGRLIEVDGRPALTDLHGRADVRFRSATGTEVPCVDLTQQLQRCGARGWTVHQHPDGSVTAVLAGGDRLLAERALSALLRQSVQVSLVDSITDLGPGKPRRYRSDASQDPYRPLR
ncbi:CoF synthetase [Gordonia sp. CPCC 205515]|uniref:CoF synthetase n=1 Tax=Gordonia sp. CPCC 205515 TaxID=3140791 RepID=UPI003AF3A189